MRCFHALVFLTQQVVGRLLRFHHINYPSRTPQAPQKTAAKIAPIKQAAHSGYRLLQFTMTHNAY
jgi:hypothetical protein